MLKKSVLILCIFLGCWQAATAESSSGEIIHKEYSVLSLGPTLKISVSQSGIYQITYRQLADAGLLKSAIPSKNIALYGNRAGALSRYNQDELLYDDLSPLPIQMFDGNDGKFDEGDYFIFYGQGPVLWDWKSETLPHFTPRHNYYSEVTYYFVGIHEKDTENRIQTVPENTQTPDLALSDFQDYVYHKQSLINPCEAGLVWLGENLKESGSYHFPLPDVISQEKSYVNISIGTPDQSVSTVSVSIQDTKLQTSLQNYSDDCSQIKAIEKTLPLTANCNIDFSITTSGYAKVYLNRIWIEYPRHLRLYQGSVLFRSALSKNKTVAYHVGNANSNTQVWEVSDPYRTHAIASSLEGNELVFIAEASPEVKEFIAFNPGSYRNPTIHGIQPVQNLHASAPIDLAIVSHPLFLEQAERLARIHRERHNLSVLVTTTQDVYNEFSTAQPDPSAIRLLMRMFYKKSQRKSDFRPPKYLLLFGATSFDIYQRYEQNYYFVPTNQSYLNSSHSLPLEDAFAYLEDNEGASDENSVTVNQVGNLDIAVGRLPVYNATQAKDMVDKIDIYTSMDYIYTPQRGSNMGPWKKEVCFVADDGERFDESYEEKNMFGDYIQTNSPEIKIQKIYSDAYKKEANAVLATYPGAKKDLLNAFDNGKLFIGYLGHSSWEAWSDERIFSISDLGELKPTHRFPIVFASSCSFAAFDRIKYISGAVQCLLLPQAGAIASIAASRDAYQGSIENIQSDFVTTISDRSKADNTIGNAFLYAKNKNLQKSSNYFVLMGDPALPIPHPEYHVVTTKINGKPVTETSVNDTLKAFSKIQIEGEVRTEDPEVLADDFNGYLTVEIYDKPIVQTTLGNENSKGWFNNKVPYTTQNSILYKGISPVKDGKFSFVFIVPKDISYNYGYGKISYYAYDSLYEGSGVFNRIVVGGFDENSIQDTTPPEIRLYINKDNFIQGGTVGKDARLFAKIRDDYGINVSGAGIGHDIRLIIDQDYANPINLNNHFTYSEGSYTDGTIDYPLELGNGKHLLELTAWNIYNLSNTAKIHFEIDTQSHFEVYEFYASPNPVGEANFTQFYFNHNGVGDLDRVEIFVFELSGKLVNRSIYSIDDQNGYSVGPFPWYFKNNDGGNLAKGFYLCKIRVFNKNGEVAEKICKLIKNR